MNGLKLCHTMYPMWIFSPFSRKSSYSLEPSSFQEKLMTSLQKDADVRKPMVPFWFFCPSLNHMSYFIIVPSDFSYGLL